MNCLSPLFYFGVNWRKQSRVDPSIAPIADQDAELTKPARSKRASVRMLQGALIVMLAAEALQINAIGRQ